MSARPADGVFDRVAVLTLRGEEERLEQFYGEIDMMPGGWPWLRPVPYYGVDHRGALPPPRWHTSGGAYGCYLSHLGIISGAQADGIGRLLVLEDDATFAIKFSQRAPAFVADAPAGWGMLALGGQEVDPPDAVDPALEPWQARPMVAAWRTHAYAIRHHAMAAAVDGLMGWGRWRCPHHVDCALADMQMAGKLGPVARPVRWLVGQAAGRSTVSGCGVEERWWHQARSERGW